MTLRVSLSSNPVDRSQWIGAVDGGSIPIVTRHSSSGTSETVLIYIFNDGNRDSDGVGMELEYKRVLVAPRGKRTRILTSLNEDISPTTNTIPVEDPKWYGSGTKLITDPIVFGGNAIREEFWVKSIQGNNLVVDRGQNGTSAITIPNRQWVEAYPDHIALSLTGKEGTWVQGSELLITDILTPWTPVKVYFRASTGALKTQVKIDSYLSISSDEYPKLS
jgi:hypothetical protein